MRLWFFWRGDFLGFWSAPPVHAAMCLNCRDFFFLLFLQMFCRDFSSLPVALTIFALPIIVSVSGKRSPYPSTVLSSPECRQRLLPIFGFVEPWIAGFTWFGGRSVVFFFFFPSSPPLPYVSSVNPDSLAAVFDNPDVPLFFGHLCKALAGAPPLFSWMPLR